MATQIDFYFDFSSPYGYLASEKIDNLAARFDREVVWHPMLLGVAFKTTGSTPLPQVPLKGEYSVRDFARSARFLGLAYRHPSVFPVATQSVARVFLWLDEHDRDLAKDFAHACLRAYFAEGINISEMETLVSIASSLGIDSDALNHTLNGAAIKERLKGEVNEALARGVFGSPFFFVDGEPFWGVDRLPQVEQWLATGGF
jgi:2-hydroxychromene-2-carboxylate isomerase